jgi:hypothetical protein
MTHHSLALLHVDLVAQHNKREVVRVSWRRLDQELIPPAVKRIEALGVVDVEHQHAAVGAAVERNA